MHDAVLAPSLRRGDEASVQQHLLVEPRLPGRDLSAWALSLTISTRNHHSTSHANERKVLSSVDRFFSERTAAFLKLLVDTPDIGGGKLDVWTSLAPAFGTTLTSFGTKATGPIPGLFE